MPGIGLMEIVVIGIILLVFLNPKDWPKFIYHVGRIYAQLQNAYRQVTDRLRQIERDVRAQVETELDSDKTEDESHPSADPPTSEPKKDAAAKTTGVSGAVAAQAPTFSAKNNVKAKVKKRTASVVKRKSPKKKK